MKILRILLAMSLMTSASNLASAQDDGSLMVAVTPISIRADVCREAISNGWATGVSGAVASGAGYAAYRLWRLGGTTALRRTLGGIGTVVGGMVAIGSTYVTYNQARLALALMDICTADSYEISRLHALSDVGLLKEENQGLQILVSTYGPRVVHDMLELLAASDAVLMQNGLTNIIRNPRSEEQLRQDEEIFRLQEEQFPIPEEAPRRPEVQL